MRKVGRRGRGISERWKRLSRQGSGFRVQGLGLWDRRNESESEQRIKEEHRMGKRKNSHAKSQRRERKSGFFVTIGWEDSGKGLKNSNGWGREYSVKSEQTNSCRVTEWQS